MPGITLTPEEDLNPYRIAQQQVDQASRYLPHLRPGLVEFLKQTARIVTVDFPIETDDGSIRMFTGYRALHSRIRGPGKGGLRFHFDVTEDEVARSGVLDDLEMCGGQRSVWRHQRGRGL